MKRPQRQTLDRLLTRYSNPSPERMKTAIERVQERLRNVSDGDSMLDFELPRRSGIRRFSLAIAAAAVAVLAIAVGGYFRPSNNAGDVRAVVESGNGSVLKSIRDNEMLHAKDGTAAIKLVDGSRVEMRSGTRLYLEESDGIHIHLVQGSVIVTAAKQESGHLYVQTKDMTVSVVGTVFLVNAEEEGSRVAVIEGEVRVQQRDDTKTLLPGEQLSTNPKLQSLPVEREVAWSPSAPVHLALLEQAKAPSPAPPVPPRLEFAAISIRPPVPGGGPTGFACRGVDGIRRADAGESGNPGFPAPQGRCVGYGVSLARLIQFAYNMPHRYGPEAPDWSKPYMNPPDERPRAVTGFQVEAVAENAATVTLEQLRLMLQAMLADRFKLEFHRETQEVPIYVLGIANGGIKFKEATGEESLPTADFSTLGTAGGPTLRGRSRISKLAQFVSAFINPTGFITGEVASHAEDRTGLPGVYEYELVLPIPGGGSRGANPAPQGRVNDTAAGRSFAWRAPALAEALEEQLGLKMQLQNVRSEVLVVDKVEKPSEN